MTTEAQEQEQYSPTDEVEESAQYEETNEAATEETEQSDDSATSESGEESATAQEDPEVIPYSRFKEVYGKAKRLEREADFWRQQAIQIQGQAQQVPQEQKAPVPGPGEPKEEDYEDYSQYVKALARHEYQQAARQAEEQNRRAAEAQRAREFQKRCETAKERMPDWDDVVRDPSLPLTADIVETVSRWEAAPDVLYYLGQHPDECLRIAQMGDPRDQAAELGVIRTKIAGSTAPPKRVSTNTLRPVKPVGNREGGTVDPDKMTVSEWIEYANKRDGIAT